ncbi:MAG: monooxygenase [Acidimicrobiales bacterium]|nr:monooxygenase [Acidimicrobiales bacterium]
MNSNTTSLTSLVAHLEPRGAGGRRRVVIAGGGIAGLACAVALQQVGADVTVHERRIEGLAGGHGFLLCGGAGRSLAALGIAVRGSRLRQFERRGPDGGVLGIEPLHDTRGITRQAVADALDGSLQPGTVRSRSSATQVRWSGGRPALLLDDGEEISADLVVGADGISSNVRRSLFPEVQPVPGRVHELVGHVDAPQLAEQLGDRFVKFHDLAGTRAIGLVRCGGSRVVWYLQAPAGHLPEDGRDHRALARSLHALVGGWPSLVRELLAHVEPERMHLWRAADLDPLPTFHRRGVVLVGDAAHALLPFTSQGVAAAVEDAVVLARSLVATGWLTAGEASTERLADGLDRYEQERRPALRRFSESGRQQRDNFLAGTDDPRHAVPIAS